MGLFRPLASCCYAGKQAVNQYNVMSGFWFLDIILKSRDITLPTKVHLVKAMVFPVVMYECQSWTIKKAEHQRIDAFELWCWRRLSRVPLTARRSNQSILKEISPEYSLEGLMLGWSSNTLATWWEELTHLKKPWCWERLKAGGEVDNRGWDGLMASLSQWTWAWVNSGCWWWTGRPGMLHSQRVGHDWVTELNWTHPTRMGHGGEFWQNRVHLRREWQNTSAFLPWEPHGQYEKAKRYDTERRSPEVSSCLLCYWRRVEK